jgi:hypothetical protein
VTQPTHHPRRRGTAKMPLLPEPSCLYPDEKELGRLILGSRAATWPGVAAVWEKEGLPRVDALTGGRYYPAVQAFLDARYGLGPPLSVGGPDEPENPNYDADRKKRWRRDR